MARPDDRMTRLGAAPESPRATDRTRRKMGSAGHEVGGAPMVRRARGGANAGTSAGAAM